MRNINTICSILIIISSSHDHAIKNISIYRIEQQLIHYRWYATFYENKKLDLLLFWLLIISQFAF